MSCRWDINRGFLSVRPKRDDQVGKVARGVVKMDCSFSLTIRDERYVLNCLLSLKRVIKSKRIETVNGNKLTDVLTKLLAADFQRKTRLDPFENKRSKAKMWNATEVSKNVLSTLNSAKVR